MERHDIEELLEQMGRTPVADPDDLAVARIERRWRAASEGLPHAAESRPVRASRRYGTPSRRVAVAGATALVGVAASVALVVAVQSRSIGTERIVVADATDIVVVLPNGETVEPLAGEQLPDGAVIQAGDAASGEIGAIEVSPRTRYVVRNGSIERYDESPGTTASPPASSVSIPATSTTGVVGASGAVTPTSRPSEPKAPTTPPTSNTTPTGPRPARLGVRATAEPKPGGRGSRVQVTWAATDRPEVRRYVVIRVRSWNGRTLPAGKRIASIKAGGNRAAIDRNPKPGTFYVVAAIGPGNRVIAIGSVEAPTIPA